MSYRVTKNEHVIDLDTRSLISVRYKRITKAVNQTFWNSISDTAHVYTHLKLADAKDELEKLKVREQVKKEMALIDMEYAKRELKRVSGV